MSTNQRENQERETYARFVDETRPALKKYRSLVIVISVIISLLVIGLMAWYWSRLAIAHSTTILIGGQLYAFYGALLLALRAFSNPATLAKMSTTMWDGNPKLFLELMKSRFSAIVGIYFVVGGFAIQAATKFAFGV